MGSLRKLSQLLAKFVERISEQEMKRMTQLIGQDKPYLNEKKKLHFTSSRLLLMQDLGYNEILPIGR